MASAIFVFVVISLVIIVGRKWEERYDEKQNKKNAASSAREELEFTKEILNDAHIAKVHLEFLTNLIKYPSTPTAIKHRKAYVYRHLMTPWYAALAAKYRYDDNVFNKIKKDWLDYIELLEEHETSAFSAEWAKIESKREAYSQEATVARNRFVAIEDSFAATIGSEAVAELGEIRERLLYDFHVSGEHLAPDGYEFDGNELIPDTHGLFRKRHQK